MANIGNGLPYFGSGFRLDGSIEEGDLITYPVAAVKINLGEACFLSSGNVTNVGTAFAATFLGFAAETIDNSAGAAAALSIKVIKTNSNKFFWVPVGSATLVTAAAVGTVVDLKTNHSVDITDTTLSSFGFEISDFDASTLAVAANAAGYVRGRVMSQPQ